jgi:hypothetical protein
MAPHPNANLLSDIDSESNIIPNGDRDRNRHHYVDLDIDAESDSRQNCHSYLKLDFDSHGFASSYGCDVANTKPDALSNAK